MVEIVFTSQPELYFYAIIYSWHYSADFSFKTSIAVTALASLISIRFARGEFIVQNLTTATN